MVAFLGTLTDGFVVPTSRNAYAEAAESVLHRNYPNPFNPKTQLSFTLPEEGSVRLAVYDVAGRQIAVLANGHREAGRHSMPFDGSGLSSGVYFYRLEADGLVEQRKMVLMK